MKLILLALISTSAFCTNIDEYINETSENFNTPKSHVLEVISYYLGSDLKTETISPEDQELVNLQIENELTYLRIDKLSMKDVHGHTLGGG